MGLFHRDVMPRSNRQQRKDDKSAAVEALRVRAFGGRGILIARRADRYWLHDDTCPAYQSHARTDCDCKPVQQGALIAKDCGAVYHDDAYTERTESLRRRETSAGHVAAYAERNRAGMIESRLV